VTATFFTPAVAAALMVLLELLFGPRPEARLALVWLVGTALAAVTASTVVLLAATLAAGRSVGLTLAGMAAAVAAVGLVRVLLARR
jgi:hypothetical protein